MFAHTLTLSASSRTDARQSAPGSFGIGDRFGLTETMFFNGLVAGLLAHVL